MNKVFFLLFFLFLCAETGGFSSDARNRLKYNESKKVQHIQREVVQSEDERTQKDILDPKHLRENASEMTTEVTSKPASASTPSEEAQVSPTMPSPTGNVVAVSTALTRAVSGESYTSSSHTSSTFSNVTTKATFFTSHSTATDNSPSSYGPSAEPSRTTSDATTSIDSTSAPLGETHTLSTTLSTTEMEASRRTASPSAPSGRTDIPPPSTNPTGSDVGTTLATIWTTLVETHSPTVVHNHSTHMSPTPAHVATRTTYGNTPSGETHTSLITLDSTGRDVTIDIALTTSLSPEIHTSSPRTLNDFVTSSMSTTSARQKTSSSDTDLSPSASPSTSASNVTSIPSTSSVSGEIHTSAKAPTAITNHVNSDTPSPSPLTVETPIYSSPTITDVNKSTVFMTSSPGETQRSIANTGHTDNKGSTVMDPTDSPVNQTQSPTENGSTPGTHVTATPAATKTLSKETTSPSTEANSTLTDVSHQTALTSLSEEAYTPTSSGTTPENETGTRTQVTSKPASTSTPSEETQVSPTMPSPTGNVVAVSTALTGAVSRESYTSSSHTSSTFSNVTTKATFFTSHSTATDNSPSSYGPSAEPSRTTSDATTSIDSTSAPLGETHTLLTTLSTTEMEASRRTASPSAPSGRTDIPPPSTNPTGSDVGTTLATIWTTLVETHSPTVVHNHSTHMSPTPAHVATRTTYGNTPSGETHTSLITLDSTGRDVTIDIALTTSLSPEIHTSSPRTLNDFVTSSMSTTSARQKTSSSDTDLSPSASPSTSASNVTSIPSTSSVSGEIHTSAKAPTAITNHVNSDTPSPSPLTVETPIYSSPTITDVNKSTVFMTSSPGETQRSIANTGHTDNKGSTVMDPTDSPVNQTQSPTENGSTPGTHVTATPAPTKTLSKETTSPSTEANSTLTDVSHQTALTSLSEEAYTPTSSGTTPENETGTRTEVTSKPASTSTPSEEAQVSPTMPSPTGNVVAVSTALTGAVSGESYTSLSHTSSTFSNVTTKATFFTSHSTATDNSASSYGPSAEPSTRTSDATTSIVSTSAPLGETHTPSTTLSTTEMEASRRTASPSAPSERTESPPPSTNPTGSTPSAEAQVSPTMPNPTGNDVTVSTSLSGTLSVQSYTSSSYISIPFSNVTTSVTPSQEIPSPSAETSSPFTTKITIAESTSSASTTKTTTAKSTSSASTTKTTTAKSTSSASTIKTTTAKSTIRTTTSELCHNGGTYDGTKCLCNEDLFYGPKCEFPMDEIPINELSVTITIEAQVRITNKEYKKSLEDLNSKYSQEIQAQFKKQMKYIYGAVPGYLGVEILRMRNGSIIVEHKVISQIEMKNNEEAIQQNLKAVTGAVNHSLADIHTDGECLKDSGTKLCFDPLPNSTLIPRFSLKDTCKNISDSKYADYYYPHMMEGTVHCISRCFNGTQDSMNCYNGVCRLSEIGPYCSCNKSDMFWYLDSYCQLPVQKTALGLGLAVAMLFVVSITLTVFLIRAKRKKSKNSWSADADTWYGEDADEEWIPSGSLNIMNKTAVSSWDKYQDRKKMVNLSPHSINTSLQKPTEFYHGTHPESSS